MARRIVSLLPSATEIVCALGLGEELVARSHECDFPMEIGDLPALTEPKFQGDGSSRAIHDQVTAILQHDLSVYRVDAERLRELAPTHIVTQVQCEVCAVSLRDVEEAIATWSGLPRPRIVPLNPRSLADVLGDIERTAAALDVFDAGTQLVSAMRTAMDSVATVAREAGRKPRVATVEWIEPLMTAGNWMPELIELAGGTNLLGQAGEHSPFLDWDDLLKADPEILLLLPCGFGIQRTLEEMPALTTHPSWAQLPAATRDQVFVLDGNQYFNRPGPRLVDSLEILAEIIHPDRFEPRHEGSGWIRWRK